MLHLRPRLSLAAIATVTLLAAPAQATYHLMQIEQVIAGVNGDTSLQAIQLRMRFDDQDLLSPARLVVRDSRGQNPVVLFDFASNVANAVVGSRILLASEKLASCLPGLVPDFTLTRLIPESYFNAGSLTFETDDGAFTVFRLSWGGTTYFGPTTGSSENDDNGDYGSAFAGRLPSTGTQALRFQGTSSDVNTTNAASFALTTAAATFTNNGGASFDIVECSEPATDPEGEDDADDTQPPMDEPAPEDQGDDQGVVTDAETTPSDEATVDTSCGQCGPGGALACTLTPLTLWGMRRRRFQR